jgi:hypothetical protein
VSRQGEDLQRKARAAGNAIIFIQVAIEYLIRSQSLTKAISPFLPNLHLSLGCRKPPGCGPYACSALKQVCFN